MGLSKAIIAIKGNHLQNLKNISTKLNYSEEDNELFEELSDSAKFENGWTILNDYEMIYVLEEDLLSELSEELETEIFTFIVQTASATYEFGNFNNGICRIFFVQEGEIISDIGEKLYLEEEFEIDENISLKDIIGIADKIGIELEE